MWGFTFDPLIGEFILSHPDIRIPDKGKIYSFNEGNYMVRRELQPVVAYQGVGGVRHILEKGKRSTTPSTRATTWRGGSPAANHFRMVQCWMGACCSMASNDSPLNRPPCWTAPLHLLQLWTEEQRKYIDSLKEPSNWGGKPYSSRYIGSLVGDFHRTLLYGE